MAQSGKGFVYRAHADTVLCIEWSQDGTYLASGGYDKTVRVWHAASGRTAAVCDAPDVVCALCWTKDERRILGGGWGEHGIAVWDRHSGRALASYATPMTATYRLARSPDGAYVALAGEQGHSPRAAIPLLDAETGMMQRTYRGHEGSWVADAAWSPRGDLIASAGYDDGTARVWRAESGATVYVGDCRGAKNEVNSVSWSPDGARLAVGTRWGLYVFDVNADAAARHVAQDSWIARVAWSPLGDMIAVIDQDQRPRLFDGVALEPLHGGSSVPRAKAERVASLTWSPRGNRLATGQFDGSVQVWDLSLS